ncbi:MAG: peptidoglycan DD-metalloendopeptidase family protein [Rhodobacteraceae bacterium]|nr:peptidoglycan DD-metalloendopeptidase family protein [Paracoccaceae bacterium]
MTRRITDRLRIALEQRFPERRLFLRSETETRFVRLKPVTQIVALAGSTVVVGWTIVATAILLMDAIGSGSAREQALREQAVYEARIDELSMERDSRASEAQAAQARFAVAMAQISDMQSALLTSEERRKELETGIGVIQSTLRQAMNDRDDAREALQEQTLAAAGATATLPDGTARTEDMAATLGFLTAALGQTAAERDAMSEIADGAKSEADDLAYEIKLMAERQNDIFTRLEEAVTISMEPLDKMFKAAGLDPDDLISQVQRGYSGQGGPLGPLMPALPATVGKEDAERAENILQGLDRMNLYRIAVEKTPLALPLKTAFRYTSGFGRRWGRMHEGTDLAGSYGSPIYATADGVVTHSGWESGYGNLVTIKHDFGLETRYGHMSRTRVSVGQKVSRGDRIGDMGNTGRSTGTHLHYEVRVNGNPVNPMTFIKAAKNVF